MNRIGLIIKREYSTRVKKRSFIIMTILGPILMAALMIVPAVISQMSDEKRNIAVIDESGTYFRKLETNSDVKFTYISMPIEQAKLQYEKDGYDGILFIPDNEIPNRAYTYSKKQMGLGVKSHIQNSMKNVLENFFMEKVYSINMDTIKSLNANNRILLDQKQINEKGVEEDSSSEISTVLGFFSGFVIYLFIFMFGAQVMRGVIEEKTSRIVEVIISSVKPIQLMFGKIIGVALVGLTQFLLWVFLTAIIVFAFQFSSPEMFKETQKNKIEQTGFMKNISQDASKNSFAIQSKEAEKEEVSGIFDSLKSINFGLMILMFILYFLGGYLLYAALFAAIGSAVDSEADTQQFMLPITIPLIFAIIMAQFVTNNPDGPIAFWLSMIPFTSPIIMMVRIPFGVPIHELVLSMSLLIFGFIFTTWLAAKIYRTGILMYGKKINYKELWKWLRY